MKHKQPTTKKSIYKRVWFIILIVLIAGGAYMVTSSNKDKHSDDIAKVEKDSVKVVELKTIAEEYLINSVVADDSYKGKELEFTGTIKTVSEGINGVYNIGIDGGKLAKNQFEDIHVSVSTDEKTAKSVYSGETRTFIAEGDGARVIDGWVSALMFKNAKVK